MSVFIAILLALGAGLLVGSRVHGARDARASYSASRARAAKGLGDWIRSTVSAGIAVAAAAILLFLVFSVLRQG